MIPSSPVRRHEHTYAAQQQLPLSNCEHSSQALAAPVQRKDIQTAERIHASYCTLSTALTWLRCRAAAPSERSSHAWQRSTSGAILRPCNPGSAYRTFSWANGPNYKLQVTRVSGSSTWHCQGRQALPANGGHHDAAVCILHRSKKCKAHVHGMCMCAPLWSAEPRASGGQHIAAQLRQPKVLCAERRH